ncbi:MAG: hypothetical protein KGL15_11045 [Acidobacteriota bacterium]|nr:hypothetical protein [Acidobacteriota bacterium]
MGFAHRAFVAVGVGFAVSAIVGCGSSGGRWLSASEKNSLSEQLNRVTQALDDQRCADARQYLADFQASVNSLGGVNSTLIANLDQGASTIRSLASSQCQTQTVTTPKKTHTKTVTSPTRSTTATQTVQTFTQPTQTDTQPTYSQPTYPPNTTTTGGTCPTCGATTSTSGTTSPTTSQSGGTGLGGTDTSTSGATTSSTTSTTSTGGGF